MSTLALSTSILAHPRIEYIHSRPSSHRVHPFSPILASSTSILASVVDAVLILAPAARRSSLGELGAESFDPSGKQAGGQLLTVGFNARQVNRLPVYCLYLIHCNCAASAWMYSLVNVFSWRRAGTGQSHEMKIIFHRLSALSQFLLHAYFIFDGPDCPQLKRGKDVPSLSAPRLLSQRFQELLTVFGFNWHVAPGEAEAELACLQLLGLIDAVATPYNDALLFGATCIIRRYEDVYIYTPDAIEKDASLEWGDLLLVMLMSGADNNASGSWCSVEVARRLAYYGFGRSLLEATVSFPFVEFMDFVTKWRDDVCEVLKTDPRRLLGGKHHEVAHIIKEERTEFPDPTVLAMYLLPLTSWSDGRSPAITTTSQQPDLHSLAMFCLQCLSWSPSIIQSELMDALAGTAMRALLQLPGNIDGGQLRHGLRVTSYSDDGLLPMYKISFPTQLLALPLDVDASPDVHMSPLGEDGTTDLFYELEIPAIVLEYSRPDLVQDFPHLSSQSSCVGFEDEDARGRLTRWAVGTSVLESATPWTSTDPHAIFLVLNGFNFIQIFHVNRCDPSNIDPLQSTARSMGECQHEEQAPETNSVNLKRPQTSVYLRCNSVTTFGDNKLGHSCHPPWSEEFHLKRKMFEWAFGEIKTKSNRSPVNLGETCGTPAKQAICKPTTQECLPSRRCIQQKYHALVVEMKIGVRSKSMLMSILDEDPHAGNETPTMLFNDEGGIKTKREWVLETDGVNLNHPLESLASILDEDRDAGDETPDESKPETLHAAGVLSPANATSPRYFTKPPLPHADCDLAVTLLLVTSAPSTPACLRENPGVAMEELGTPTTECAAPSRPSKKPKRGARASTAKEQPSLHVVHQIKEAGKQTHLRAAKTRETYSRHVHQARLWLQGHFPLEGAPQILAHTEHESEIYSDPGFKNAFERVPNQCSDKALALYLSWRGFQENCSQSTVDGVRAAFKMLWDESDGATFRGSWHHNDARHWWEGNPVLSAEVNDIVASIRHKLSSDGAEQTHSGAMKKEYMDRILTWSASQCPLVVPFQYLRLAMMGCRVPPPGEFLSKSMKLTITRHLQQHSHCGQGFDRNYELVKLKCGDVNLDKIIIDEVFMKYLQGGERSLTINDLNVYFEIHLTNRKGWQRKLDKGMREVDLRSNRYRIYPRPDMGSACDAFLHLVFWMKWVEFAHLGRPMSEEDFLFPAIGANGVLQPGEPLSHDTVQAWINEAVAGAGIPGTFSTHSMDACTCPMVGQRWTLARVRWWGGWAEGEHRDTLMRYLLNELHCYENDHSDALRPVSREGDRSFAGEAALVRPASTEALQAAHASLTAGVSALHTTVKEVCSSQAAMSVDVQEIRQQLNRMSNLVTTALTSTSVRSGSEAAPCPGISDLAASVPQSHGLSHPVPATVSSRPTQFAIPQPVQPSNVSRSVPSQRVRRQRIGGHPYNIPRGLLIPNVPVLHADRTRTPKSDSWKDIVRHWTEGEPRLGLTLPLKDWPHHYHNGPLGRQFNTKYYQRSVIATEFLDEFQGNEEAFLEAYGSAASQGHTKLLKAVLDACKQHPEDGACCSHLANEQRSSPSHTSIA
ncbi:hypothetical protein EDD15DRAFT_2191570 [Pisolithus albus]|nr:hypothetical protein EDD15DRAFT_2191570 [Pisolithus albus]